MGRKPIRSAKIAFTTAAWLACLSGKISQQNLHHTAATWLMQSGVDKWEAAGFLGMSMEILDCVYGHHPDAAAAVVHDKVLTQHI